MLSNVSKTFWDRYYNILSEMILQMTSASNSESISECFCTVYLPLCGAIIENSKNVLCYTQSTRVQTLAENLIQYLSEAIEGLKSLNMENTQNCIRDLRLYTRKSNALMCKMFSQAENASVLNSIDKSYIVQTVHLLNGGAELCKNALNYSISKELYVFALHNIKTLSSFRKSLVTLAF